MSSSPDARVTRPLTGNSNQPLVTLPLPTIQQTGTLYSSPTTSTKVPVVIPGKMKPRHTAGPNVTPRKRRFALPGVLFGSVLVALLAFSFVVPLDNGQRRPHTFAQVVGNFLTNNTQNGSIDTSGHNVTSTAAVITSGDGGGSCRGTDIWSTCAAYTMANGAQGTGRMQRPIAGAVITQGFGHPEYQAWCGCWKPHTGIDLAAPYGTPILAADTGQVIWVGWDWSGLGWAVKISHGNYISTIYGHMDRYIVKVGQFVSKGQIIGYEGSSGASTGPHVHFMVLVHNNWVDPTLYVALP